MCLQVLTPNKPEYGRLVGALTPDSVAHAKVLEASSAEADAKHFAEMARSLGGPTIVRKGCAAAHRAHGLRSAIAASSRPRMDVAIAQADRLGERWEW